MRKNFLLWIKGVQGVTNLSYLSLAVAWTVENMLFHIVLLTCGIVYQLTLLHATLCIALSERSMLFCLVRGLYRSVMTFFPLPTGYFQILAQWLR
jgi:hypothetical protein